MKRYWFVLLAVILIGAGGCAEPAAPRAKAPTSLVVKAVYSGQAPKIDGRADDPVWKKAEPTRIPMADGRRTAVMKSVYTESMIYFLVGWEDKTFDDGKKFWEFDGSRWRADRSGDRLVFLWNIDHSIRGFDRQGCQIVCHDPKANLRGMRIVGPRTTRGYWPGYRQRGDAWKWAPGAADRIGVVDDGVFSVDRSYLRWPQVMDPYIYMRFDNGDQGTKQWWTRNPETGPEDNGRPKMKLKSGLTPEDTPFPYQSQTQVIADYSVFKAGDKLPLFMYFDVKADYNKVRFPHGKPEGSRLDLKGKGGWADGRWTVEIARRLNTGHDDDVQFKPSADGPIFDTFGIAVFKDEEAEHWASPPVTLALEPKP